MRPGYSVISCRNPQHHRVHHLPYSSFFPTGLPTFEGQHCSREAGVGRHEAWVQSDQLQKPTTSPCPSPSVLFVLPNRLTYVHPRMPVIPLVPPDSPTLISSLLRLSAHHLALVASALQPLKSGTLSLYLSVQQYGMFCKNGLFGTLVTIIFLVTLPNADKGSKKNSLSG